MYSLFINTSEKYKFLYKPVIGTCTEDKRIFELVLCYVLILLIWFFFLTDNVYVICHKSLLIYVAIKIDLIVKVLMRP